MRYTEALRKLFEVMEGRPDIKEVKFDRENDSFDVISDTDVHVCFGNEFRNSKIGIQSEKMEDKSMDNRNYDVTNKIFEVLDNVKGFDVAMSNPREGKIIARHNGISFYVTIEPIFNDNAEGREADNKPFEEVVKTHKWIWK